MKCFVIMPFGNPTVDAENARKLDSIYTQWIKPTIESITIPGTPNEKITCHRADKTFKPGEIIAHVIENLISAQMVIADLSGRNPNVFYELGVRHAVGSNCILIADNLEDVPFDLRLQRTIIYQYEPESMLRLKDSLERAIVEILQDPNTIDNPVRNFIYHKELNDAVKQSSSSESELVKTILSEMASLRKEFNAQSDEMRQIMKLITAAPTGSNLIKSEPAINLQDFEGVWRDRESQSIFYVRVIDGELYVPYSYNGYRKLTGHLYNCNVIDKTLFGRFEWFDLPISGYISLRIERTNQIKGGWWYTDDVPQELLKDLSKVSDSLPKMNKLFLEKVSGLEKIPSYIEKYFRKK